VTGVRPTALLPWLAIALLLGGCGRNMVDQPRLGALEASPFFADGVGSRLPVPGTVAREFGGIDPVFYTGQGPAGFVTEMPVELTVDLLRRGQERYDIYCALCHGYTGESDGMIVSRGFPAPTSFQDPRLLEAPVGYFFGVMTDGFGRMFPYASRIPAEDRWAIAGYVKALQLSQNASPDDVPPDVRLQLAPTEGRLR
jgi:mono/diheme cytochrome c family protein